jgi:signal peptidase II
MSEESTTPEPAPETPPETPPVTPPADPKPQGWGRIVWLIAFVAFTAIDLGTTSWAFHALGADVQTAYVRTGEERATFVKPREGDIAYQFPAVRNPDEAMVTVIPGCFDFQASINTGAVFGILAGKLWALMGFTLVAIALIGGILWKADPRRLWLHFAFGLICSGAAGNLYDRVTLAGVRDFIKWYYGTAVWPTFNIADAALVVGIGIIIIAEFKAGRDAKADDPATAATS